MYNISNSFSRKFFPFFLLRNMLYTYYQISYYSPTSKKYEILGKKKKLTIVIMIYCDVIYYECYGKVISK